MRNRLLAAAAVTLFSLTQLACGAGAPSDEDAESFEATSGENASPSKEVASAPVAARGELDTSAVFGDELAPVAVEGAGDVTAPGGEGTNPGGDGSTPGSSSGGPIDPNAGAGPKPAGTCAVSKDAQGFFVRTSPKSSYVAYVPASYDPSKPMRVIVGLHGCGDSAKNFASWGVNPAATRAKQQHIGISIGGRDGACWSLGTDDDKVLAAVDDLAKCFWIHQKKVVIGGFSSGGQLAYRVGLQKASRFAGILIEDSALYAAGVDPNVLLANATWKANIAHRTHTGDTVFPLAKVKADWVKTTAAGFPLLTSETAGGHDGVSEDWSDWLIPKSAAWLAP